MQSDARLVSSAHSGQYLFLDAVPKNGSVPLSKIYDCRWNAYKNFYPSIVDIVGGDLYYYYDVDFGVPFNKYIFDKSRTVQVEPYIDPMGTYKPHYYRNAKNVCGEGLTSLHDSQFFRADLMARMLQQRNQSLPLYAVVE